MKGRILTYQQAWADVPSNQFVSQWLATPEAQAWAKENATGFPYRELNNATGQSAAGNNVLSNATEWGVRFLPAFASGEYGPVYDQASAGLAFQQQWLI